MKIIKAISKDKLVILVTHEQPLAKFYASRIIEIKDGKVVKDYENVDNNELDYEIDNSFLQRHYVDLIYNKDLKESKYFKCQGMLKVKHRLTYEKFYLLGVPFLKISFCDNSKKIQLFGITINSKSYKYS